MTSSPPRPGTLAELRGWGTQAALGHQVYSDNLERDSADATLSRGLGRSYGDAALPTHGGRVLTTPLADRLLSFDSQTGILRAEAGLSVVDLKRLFLPRGWFVPVTPGTQYVTLGGMVGSDVHGKNHHVDGCIGRHIRKLRMRVADGRLLEVTRQQHSDLFAATLGGQGLTGHILEVELTLQRVPTPWIWQESSRIDNIDAFCEALQDAAARWPFTVGWIDCLARGAQLGRGLLVRGRWAEPHEAPDRLPGRVLSPIVPFRFPDFALNDWSVAAFNQCYYWKHLPRHRRGIVHPQPFFYPLDAFRHWNRIYGSRGFTQHQGVIPREAGHGAVRRYLELLASRGGASFLCVIKDCGEQGEGLLSFPKPGVSIALDLPLRSDTQDLIDDLNRFLLDVGGRVYLAKDSFTRAEHYRAMEPRLERFNAIRRTWDPDGQLRSALSVRLLGDAPRT